MMDYPRFAQLFAAHAARLVLYARQWLDRSAAEDVVQEVYLRLLAQRTTPDNLKAWLYRAVRNEAISQQRAVSRRRQREQKSAAAEAWFEPDQTHWLDGAAARAALEALPDVQREVILLRIWGQMTLKEVAQITGSSTSSVFDQYRAGLKALREVLGVTCEENNEH
jgi:RNA polymerase sigma factor (sigma-70 family)